VYIGSCYDVEGSDYEKQKGVGYYLVYFSDHVSIALDPEPGGRPDLIPCKVPYYDDS
jgi:hypothetical protein